MAAATRSSSPLADGLCQVGLGGQEGYIKALISVDESPCGPQGLITGDVGSTSQSPAPTAGLWSKIYGGSLVDIINLENGGTPSAITGPALHTEDSSGFYDESETRQRSAATSWSRLSFLGTPTSTEGLPPEVWTVALHVRVPASRLQPAPLRYLQGNKSGLCGRSDSSPAIWSSSATLRAGKAAPRGHYIGNNEFVPLLGSSGNTSAQTASRGLLYGY